MHRIAALLATLILLPQFAAAEEPTIVGHRNLTPACAGGLVYDDGTFEAGYGANDTVPSSTMVMRFDPPDGADLLEQICLCFFAGGSDTTLNHTLVVYDDDGPGGSPGTLIRSLRTMVSNIPQGSSAFFDYNVSGRVTLPGGSVYIGVGSWDANADKDIFLCADQDADQSQPGYLSDDGGETWAPMGEFLTFPDYKNLGIRADVGRSNTCGTDGESLCLNDDRFRVEVTYTTKNGQSGSGTAVPLTADTGYFWFFRESNIELVVKVLDGCTTNGHFWVFAGGLTNVEVEITVTDTTTGDTATYTNPQGAAFQPLQDTSAFATCP